MRNNKVMALVLVMVLASTGALVLTADDSDAANYEARVFIDGSPHNGTGSDLRGLITSVTGTDLVIGANNQITSYKGQTAPEGKAWVLFKWVPMSEDGWAAINFSQNNMLENGSSYAIHLSDESKVGGKTVYSAPEVTPMATAYFFIQFKEQYDRPYVQNLLTEQQRRDGFWISGTGSDAALAFYNACQAYKFELRMNMGDGSGGHEAELKGYLGSFMKMVDDTISLENSVYRYWSQYAWNGSAWSFNGKCLGYFDPGVTPYFAVIRQTTYEDGSGSAPTAITPSSVNVLSPGSVWDGEPGKNELNNIEVNPTSVTLNATSLSFFESGGGQKLTASLTPSNAKKTITWASSNPSVATVDKDGNVKPLKEGHTVITATGEGGKNAICSVTVKKQPASGTFELNQSSARINIRGTVQLSGNVAAASWTSSDSGVARVDSSGKVTGVKAGTATITAVSSLGSAACTVTVRANAPGSSQNSDSHIVSDNSVNSLDISGVGAIANAGKNVILELSSGRVEIPNGVLSNIEGDTLTFGMAKADLDDLSAEHKKNVGGNDIVVSITASSSGKDVRELGGKVMVSFAYTIPKDVYFSDLSVWYLKDDGTMEKMGKPTSYRDGLISFETEHFSMFKIGTDSGSGGASGGGSTMIIAAVLVCVLAAAVIMVMRRRKTSV